MMCCASSAPSPSESSESPVVIVRACSRYGWGLLTVMGLVAVELAVFGSEHETASCHEIEKTMEWIDDNAFQCRA